MSDIISFSLHNDEKIIASSLKCDHVVIAEAAGNDMASADAPSIFEAASKRSVKLTSWPFFVAPAPYLLTRAITSLPESFATRPFRFLFILFLRFVV